MRNSHRRTIAVLGIGAVIATGALFGATSAGAKTSYAVVRAAHFSPTTPGVDVYLSPFSSSTSKLWLSSVKYGTVSPYQRLTPGLYTVALRLHGKSAGSPPALSWTLRAVGGRAYTVAGVGAGSSVKGVVLRDDLSEPKAGTGRVRVIQAASRAPSVTVTAKNGPVVAKDAAFASTTSYSTVPAGSWLLDASAGSLNAHGTVHVGSRTVTSVLVLDAKGSGITLRTITDSAGAASLPRGPVNAGGGGTAPGRTMFGQAEPAGEVALTALMAGLLVVVAGSVYRLTRARA